MRNIIDGKLLLILLTLLCVKLSFAQDSQHNEPSWRSIIPLVSTLQEVERLLGTPTKIDRRNRYYDTAAGERVTIWYSGEPDNSSCKWDVPDDTVVSMLVSPRKRPLLSQSGFDLSRFKEVRTLDDHWNYVDEEKGILINTYVSSPTEKTVILIDFSPAKKDKKRCIPTSPESPSTRDRKLRIKQSNFVPPLVQIIPEIYDLYFNHELLAAKSERLDAFAKELAERRSYMGVIVSYGTLGKSDCEALTNLKSSRINLVVANRLQAERLIFIDGGLRAKGMTEFYLVPPGADLPIPTDGRDLTTVLNTSP